VVGASSGRGRCLENKPSVRRFVIPAVLPGQLHDAVAQCKFQFGPSSVSCNETTVCLTLRYVEHLLLCGSVVKAMDTHAGGRLEFDSHSDLYDLLVAFIVLTS